VVVFVVACDKFVGLVVDAYVDYDVSVVAVVVVVAFADEHDDVHIDSYY